MIGTDEDIERRLQEQLEGPKAMFTDEERVCDFFGETTKRVLMGLVDSRAGATSACLYCNFECTWHSNVTGREVRSAHGHDPGDQ